MSISQLLLNCTKIQFVSSSVVKNLRLHINDTELLSLWYMNFRILVNYLENVTFLWYGLFPWILTPKEVSMFLEGNLFLSFFLHLGEPKIVNCYSPRARAQIYQNLLREGFDHLRDSSRSVFSRDKFLLVERRSTQTDNRLVARSTQKKICWVSLNLSCLYILRLFFCAILRW